MGFARDVAVVETADGQHFVTVSAIEYTTSAGEVITIPPGTTTDGASTPPELWAVLPPFGPYWLTCVLHDYLYRNTDRPRAECDALLDEAMAACGVPLLQREAIYQGVRLGGSWAFAHDRKDELRRRQA